MFRSLGAIAVLGATVALGGVLSAKSVPPSKNVEVTVSQYEYSPDPIEVVEGEHVVLTLKSKDRAHGFRIKKLKLQADVPKGGEPVTLEFDAPAAGTYEITCSEYCGTGHRGMKGRLVVLPRAGTQ